MTAPGDGEARTRSNVVSTTGLMDVSSGPNQPHEAKETAMTILVTDRGFQGEDWAEDRILSLEALLSGGDLPGQDIAVDFPNNEDPSVLAPFLDRLALIRVAFPAMGDGRGFSIAARLRRMGYSGRLRAAGPLIADQYPAARRTGFDEVEISDALAERQTEAAWRRLAKPDYRMKLSGT